MSILIKGMKMPEKCIECPCCYITEGAYWDSCDAVDFQNDIEKIERDGRPDWCPLVEVPTPHGDLIDRWELTETAMIDPDEGKYVAVYRADEVDEAPVVIEAEGRK